MLGHLVLCDDIFLIIFFSIICSEKGKRDKPSNVVRHRRIRIKITIVYLSIFLYFRLISYEEFQTFEGRLCVPDALYRTAFQLFDTDGSGTVSFPEFCEIVTQTSLHQSIPFPLESSDFVKLYFGKDKKRVITYAEFSQFLHDFHDEYAQVAFKAKDDDGSGFISSKDFFDIMVNIKSHLLTEPVKANLVSACQNHQVSYPFFVAFISLLSNIELIKKIYLNATNGSRTLEVTKGTHFKLF